MKTVSIIVLVYKVEKYLSRCIDSILVQSFTDFELILVDDGSPDNCPAICDEYVEKDDRIRVIHKKNGGVSSARNTGMEAARGKYFLFCDSDDYVSPYWCETLYNQIEKNTRAWLYCDVKRVSDSESAVLDDRKSTVRRISYYDSFKQGLSGYCVNKIYSSAIIRREKLLFDEQRRVGEDVVFNLRYMSYCNEKVYINRELYAYSQIEESTSHRYDSNWFAMYLELFYGRIPFVETEYLPEYCDIWLYQFLTFFPIAFDKRNLTL